MCIRDRVSAELDRGVVADYLHLGYVAAPGCIFKGIRKLPPATLLAIEDGQVREWRYWRLPEHITPGVSESEWVARVRTQIEESVRMQMAVSYTHLDVYKRQIRVCRSA